jgi:hypothetical protein
MDAPTTTPTTPDELAHFERVRAELQELHRAIQADIARLATMVTAELRSIGPPPGAPPI